MLKKDYFLKLITTFLEAPSRAVKNIRDGNTKQARVQIKDAYGLLGADRSYFIDNDLHTIIAKFKESEDDHLKRIQLLGQLMYHDFLTTDEPELKRKVFEKCESLFTYYLQHTDEYSMEVMQIFNDLERYKQAFN
ncbi:MAG: hypothetical protein KDC56_11050 [Flavobacteriaceae bacterium]|nr:hypothetical protein [Flavobacteriaceae bacterium]